MKKTILAVFFSLFILTSANAEIGLNVGVSAQVGAMDTKGEETNSDGASFTQTSDGEEHLFATAGFFIEKDLSFLPGGLGENIGSRISIGFDNIAHDIDLGTQSNFRAASLGAAGAAVSSGNNSLSAEVTGFETIYATINIFDWLYVKAGDVTVDVATTFMKSGVKSSDYGNSHSLDGNMIGFGVETSNDSGFFARLEYNSYDIGGKKVTSAGADSTLSAELKDVSGETARISIGKSF